MDDDGVWTLVVVVVVVTVGDRVCRHRCLCCQKRIADRRPSAAKDMVNRAAEYIMVVQKLEEQFR